uniref:Uncharacterized protein n=1 Tax=Otolemur garnettii TaxID=30611 RepID=H0WG31_OTOGA
MPIHWSLLEQGHWLSEKTRMSFQTPPSLLDLAVQSLVRNEALAISALEELPGLLFPPLFLEAFTRRHRRVLTAMVQAWPFTRLPLGSLMKTGDLKTLKAVLDGLDALLAQKVRPRRWNLQVLELGDVDGDFRSVWYGGAECSSEAMKKRRTTNDSAGTGRQRPVVVSADLSLTEGNLDPCLTYLVQWVRNRKDALHLCCRKLVISEIAFLNVSEVLEVVDLDCVREVEVDCSPELSPEPVFAPYLGQMSNLGKLVLCNIFVCPLSSPKEKEQIVARFTSQLFKLHNLRELAVYTGSFLVFCLHQVLRCLETPLETFLMTKCLLSTSDWENLSSWPSISQLKELRLGGIILAHLSPEPLSLLLEKIAATVQSLFLENCGIMDSQLNVIVPALSRCCQLTTLSFRGNFLSRASLEHLLRHTARLSKLRLEVYPAPLESYDARGVLDSRKYEQFRAELTEILRGIRKPKKIVF